MLRKTERAGGAALRLLPSIRYGTERYPEKVARRLRAVNFTSWLTAVFAFGFAVQQLLDPAPDVWKAGTVDLVLVFAMALVPLLHRFGPIAGALAFCISTYIAIFVICAMAGTGSGMQIQFLAVAAVSVLFFGIERFYIPYALGLLGVALIIALELLVPRDTGLHSPPMLFANFIACVVGTSAILFAVELYALREVARAERAADREYARSESLLANILPASIAARLKKATTSLIADKYDAASVLFADMSAFTARPSDTTPEELVRILNRVFTDFDQLVESYGLETIKTTGNAYMVVSGVPVARPDHTHVLARLALEIREAAANMRDADGRGVAIRIGIASGPVVAGVVGTRKFFYDVWGDAVNVASRMESTGEAGKIQVSPEAYELLKGQFVLEERGPIEVKGKGQMLTWFLVEPSASIQRNERPMHEIDGVEGRTTQHPPRAASQQSLYDAPHNIEKAVRRRRALNVLALMGSVLTGGFALAQFFDPTPGLWKLAVANGVTSLMLATIPFLHHPRPLAAPVIFISTVYAATFCICFLLGTSTGMQFLYLAATALAVLFFGAERVWLAFTFGALAAALAIALEVFAPRDTGLQPAEVVFGGFTVVVVASCLLLLTTVFYASYEAARAEAAAERESARSESLLLNILPASIAARLKRGTESIIADRYSEVSVLLADMAGFTARTSDTAPGDLVLFLNRVFTAFDRLVESHGLEKIKTTGDAYMVVSGVPAPRSDHAAALADLALDMRDVLAGLTDAKGRAVPVRIGIASGAVVAGVVGTRKFFYDVWGDAVNTASRMELTGEAGQIHVAPETRELITGRFELAGRRSIDVTGESPIQAWFLIERIGGDSNAS
jgi:adenylate cyclase